MTDNVTTQENNAGEVQLPPNPHGKVKYLSQIKSSSKYRTVHTEPLLGIPFSGSQATMKVQGHAPDSGDIGTCEFLIEGAPNPPDLEGIEHVNSEGHYL